MSWLLMAPFTTKKVDNYQLGGNIRFASMCKCEDILSPPSSYRMYQNISA